MKMDHVMKQAFKDQQARQITSLPFNKTFDVSMASRCLLHSSNLSFHVLHILIAKLKLLPLVNFWRLCQFM
jgi:hypothetical protein